MKKVLAVALVMVLAFTVSASAEKITLSKGSYAGAQGIGIGLEGGPWGGLSLKLWTSSDTAFQFNADFHWSGYFGGGIAYLWHFFDVIEVDNHKFPLYIGIKAGLWGGSNVGVDILVPLGIAWIPREIPIDIFLQYEPGIAVLRNDGTGFGPSYMGGAAGIRLWFN